MSAAKDTPIPEARLRELLDYPYAGDFDDKRVMAEVKAAMTELLALRASVAAAGAWQPIETAPHNWLLLVMDEYEIFTLAFFNGIYWFDQSQRSLPAKPIKWRFVSPELRPVHRDQPSPPHPEQRGGDK